MFVPQSHCIGAQGEADFYEAEIDFPLGRQTAQIITLRSEFSAAALHIAYPRQIQAALLEGIELGLIFQGGVFEVLRLDNLRLAVSKTLAGNRRREQDRFIAFRSHYLFRSSFTSLGIQGAHEKGGVETKSGAFAGGGSLLYRKPSPGKTSTPICAAAASQTSTASSLATR